MDLTQSNMWLGATATTEMESLTKKNSRYPSKKRGENGLSKEELEHAPDFLNRSDEYRQFQLMDIPDGRLLGKKKMTQGMQLERGGSSMAKSIDSHSKGTNPLVQSFYNITTVNKIECQLPSLNRRKAPKFQSRTDGGKQRKARYDSQLTSYQQSIDDQTAADYNAYGQTTQST